MQPLDLAARYDLPVLRIGGERPEGFTDLREWTPGNPAEVTDDEFVTGNALFEWTQPRRAWLPAPEGPYHVEPVSAHYIDRYAVVLEGASPDVTAACVEYARGRTLNGEEAKPA